MRAEELHNSFSSHFFCFKIENHKLLTNINGGESSYKNSDICNYVLLTKNDSNMQLTQSELVAMLRAGICIAKVDGKCEKIESETLAVALLKFGVSEQDVPKLWNLAMSMKPETMVSILAALDVTSKKFVCGFLATIMVSDGDVDDSEVNLWKFISYICGFPYMEIPEAVNFCTTVHEKYLTFQKVTNCKLLFKFEPKLSIPTA